MRNPKLLLSSALVLALAACGGSNKKDEFAAATPNTQALTVELQGGASEGALAPETLAVEPMASDPNPSELQAAQDALEELNNAIKAFIGKIEDAITGKSTEQLGDQKKYGPEDECVVGTDTSTCAKATFLLTVTHEHDNVYSFKVEAWAVGADESTALPVARGFMAKSSVDHRGVGRLALNLWNMAVVMTGSSPAYNGRGALLAGFASGPLGKALIYKLYGFTPDSNVRPPVWASIAGFKNEVSGTTRVRVATIKEVVPPASGQDLGPELILAHLAWNPQLGARAFTIVTNWEDPALANVPPPIGPLPIGPYGDVPFTDPYAYNWNEHYYFTRSCYAPDSSTPKFKELFLCNGMGAISPEVAEGPFACAQRVTDANATIIVQPASGDPTWDAQCTLDEQSNPAMMQPGMPPLGTPEPPDALDGIGALPPPPPPPSDPTTAMTP